MPKMGENLLPELRALLYEQEALRRVLVRKGLVSDGDVLEEVMAVRRELQAKRGR